MGWLKRLKGKSSAHSSPSSPSPSTPSSSPSLGHQKQPRLTRQRKLRHPSASDVFKLIGKFAEKKVGVFANSSPVSRSPSNLEDLPLTSKSSSLLLPHPLPLPEGLSARFPPPSPRVGGLNSPRIGEDGCTELLSALAEPVAERLPPSNNNTAGRLPYAIMPKSSELLDTPMVVQTSNNRRAVFQYSNTTDNNFRLNGPTRSAPSSAICSPRRPTSREYFPSSHLTPQPPHQLSASDFSDIVTGFHAEIPAEKFLVSSESPLHSPTTKSPGLRSQNPSPPSSPLHSRIFPENPATPSSHGNVNVHPLPLPPGAPGQIHPSFGHPSPTKGDALPKGGQWQKGKLIGKGTFGSVYKATNRQTGALCAMKEVNIDPDDPKSIECIKQLQQEIRFLSQLEHPNIVKYYGSEIIEDQFYIYLEYVYPGSINKYIHEHCSAITESVVRNFTRHILMGLAYLHNKNAIHRDIKGANLLVDSNGTVKLSDFGMAKCLTEAKCAYSLSGTPYWMAPEVLQASMNKETSYNSAVDIWSLGCTIIEMYTGKHPWSGLSCYAAMFNVLHKSPDIPETLSPEGKDFLELCFHRNPAERPSANKLLEHRFVTNSDHHDLHSSMRAFSEIKLFDDSHLSTNYTLFKNDTAMKGKHMPNGSVQIHLDNTDVTPRLSPRSILDTVAHSPPHMIQGASCLPLHLPHGMNAPLWGTRKPLNHL